MRTGAAGAEPGEPDYIHLKAFWKQQMKLKSGITMIIKGSVGQVIHGDVVMSRGIHFGGNEIIQGNGKPTLDNRPVTHPFSDAFGILVRGDEILPGLSRPYNRGRTSRDVETRRCRHDPAAAQNQCGHAVD